MKKVKSKKESAPALAAPTSSLAARGAFATRALWVTPHRDEERWPAGDYPMQSEGGEGLAAWTAGDRPCGAGHDPVIWLTLGVTHVARVEDFPVRLRALRPARRALNARARGRARGTRLFLFCDAFQPPLSVGQDLRNWVAC